MTSTKAIQEISPQDIIQILNKRYVLLMPSFYETQSSFLSGVYKRYNNIEAANIILCFARNMHLQILRQREKNLNFDVSLNNFWNNFNNISKPEEKISSIVSITRIPKETVRRKIKNLLNNEFISSGQNKKCYIWNFTLKEKAIYVNSVNNQITSLARFISRFSIFRRTIEKCLNLKSCLFWTSHRKPI